MPRNPSNKEGGQILRSSAQREIMSQGEIYYETKLMDHYIRYWELEIRYILDDLECTAGYE